MFDTQKILIFDGAIGTVLYEKGHYINRPFEELNVNAPDDVLEVHFDYISAGAEAITTNTFSITRPQLKKFDIDDKQELLLHAGLDLAFKAREKSQKINVKIGLSIGPLGLLMEPLGPIGRDEVKEEYAQVSRLAVKNGHFDFYNLETFSSIDELAQAIEGIRSVDQIRPLLASITVHPEQKTILEDFARTIATRDDVQAIGLNCSDGPTTIFLLLLK
jgi:homocysteine S-methyltransferase